LTEIKKPAMHVAGFFITASASRPLPSSFEENGYGIRLSEFTVLNVGAKSAFEKSAAKQARACEVKFCRDVSTAGIFLLVLFL